MSSSDQEILYELEKEKVLVFTPARRVSGKRIVCYDDRYIIKLATDNDGVVVSNDNYRDLINEAVEYKKVIEERLLMYSFVSDRYYLVLVCFSTVIKITIWPENIQSVIKENFAKYINYDKFHEIKHCYIFLVLRRPVKQPLHIH